MKKMMWLIAIFLISSIAFGIDFSFSNADLRSVINDIADVPNENRFFYYEIHEMNSDEYQRFRQIEQINKSGILTFSGDSFEIFREIMKINGKNDVFGNIAIQTIGEGTINLADPKFAMNVKSNQNTVNVSLITGVSAIQISMTDQKNRAVASAQSGGKNFLVLMGFADNIRSDFAFENPKVQNEFGINVFYNQGTSKILGNISYGSTELSIVGEIYTYQTAQATMGIFVGMEGNLIDQMYGKVMLGLENLTPMAKFGIRDTTSIGFVMLRGELWDEMTLNGVNPIKVSAGVGIDIWNIEVFGGIRGELQTAGPYIEISLNGLRSASEDQTSRGYLPEPKSNDE